MTRQATLSTHAFAFAFLLLGLATACSQEEAPPVARLAVTPATIELQFPRTAQLHLAWQPLMEREALGERPTVFVHLLDDRGQLLRTFDHALDVASWGPGEEIRYPVELYQSYLAENLAPGSYRVAVGLYEPGGKRYPLASAHQAGNNQELLVSEVVVPEQNDFLANLDFTGDWGRIEDGQSLQILARRWLGSSGRLTVAPVNQPLRLKLHFDTPIDIAGSTPNKAGDPYLQIESACAEAQAIADSGYQRIEVILRPPAGASSCELSFRPGTVWYEGTNGARRSTSLMVVAIDPAGP